MLCYCSMSARKIESYWFIPPKCHRRSAANPLVAFAGLRRHPQERHRISKPHAVLALGGNDADSAVPARRRQNPLLRRGDFLHRQQARRLSRFHGFHRPLETGPSPPEHHGIFAAWRLSTPAPRILSTRGTPMNPFARRPTPLSCLAGSPRLLIFAMEIFHRILKTAVEGGASDVHLKIGTPVVFRINRQLIAIECPCPPWNG